MVRRTTIENKDSDPIARAIELELVRRDAESLPKSFKDFVLAAWPQVENYPFKGGMHIDAICEHLQACAERRIKLLCVNLPPRAGKSTLISVLFPAWVLARSPKEELLHASYSSQLAVRDSVKTRTLVESDWYQSRFPHVQIRDDQNLKASFNTTAGGGRATTSVGGTVTGLGGSFLILDDPLSASEGESATSRGGANQWFAETWYNRAAGDPDKVVRIVVMQRLHDRDVSAMCIEAGWDLLSLPMEFEQVVKPTSIGWVDPREEQGELLWPEQYPRGSVEALKKALGSYAYSGQYQQRPSPRGGGVVKRTWITYWYDPDLGTPDPVLVQDDAGEWIPCAQFAFKPPLAVRVTASWDCAFKGEAKNDAVVGQAWTTQGANYILLDQIRDRMDFPQTKAAVVVLHNRWNPLPTLIEAKANGSAVIAELRHRIDGIVPVDPRGDKHSRFAAASVLFESGNVWIPHPTQAVWSSQAVTELVTFPKAPNDDVVDALSQALAHMRVRSTEPVDLGANFGGNQVTERDYGLVQEESYWDN